MKEFDVQIEWKPDQVSMKIKGLIPDLIRLHKEAGAGLEGATGTGTIEFILTDIELNQRTETPGPPSSSWFKKWFRKCSPS